MAQKMTGSDSETNQHNWINRRTILKGATTMGFLGLTGITSADNWHEITFTSVNNEVFEYQLEVTGKLKRGGAHESDNGDKISTRSVHGKCASGRSDSFLMTGEIADLTLSGSGKVSLNGQVIRNTMRQSDSGNQKLQHPESQYVLMQGNTCIPVQPLSSQSSASTFYNYQLPQKYANSVIGASVGDTTAYESEGTQELQRPQTSITFLYQGPDGISLVFVHGSVQASDGGAVTFDISGLPADGKWIVKDDSYGNSTNYDRWNTDSTNHQIDWTWGSGGTDGGVFHDLGHDFNVVIRPAFNEQASLHEMYYEGTITDWEFLSGSTDDPKRIPLNLNDPIRIKTDSC